MIKWDNGRIVTLGVLRSENLRHFCAGLYQTVNIRGFSNVVLDFSMCDSVTEATMLPLMPIIANYRKDGIEFEFVEPQDESLGRLFINANWAHHIEPDRYALTSYEGGHVPALRFGDEEAEDEGEILDRVMELILRQLETDRNTLKAVEWSLGEIMDNVSSHARSPVGGFVQATAYEVSNSVEFVVADAGIGIPASMGINDHARALRDVINEGTTSNPASNAGNGLYGTYKAADLSDGKFEIHSQRGVLYTVKDGELRNRWQKIPYGGTSVRCGIGVGDPRLLDRALQFRDQKHEPPFDYVEREYENEQGDLIFYMKEQAQRDFGSRQGGRRIRATIENLLRSHRPIILDFNGVGVFSSSFADEVFGRLFVSMGPRAFMTRIRMRNVAPTVDGLIDRAITQRTKLDNGESRNSS